MANNALAPPTRNSLFGFVTDPFSVNTYAIKKAESEYGPEMLQDRDAYRHLIGIAMLAKRQGNKYAETVGKLHESMLPIIGAPPGQTDEEKDMDTFNNVLGLEIAGKAKTDEDIFRMAREYVDAGKVRRLGTLGP